MEDTVIIGIDVGGTKIMTGLLSRRGEVTGQAVKVPTGPSDPPEAIMKRLYQSVEEALSLAGRPLSHVRGIGVGVPGPLNIRDGVFLNPIQLRTLHHFPIRRVIQDRFGLPVAVNNDANCFVLAESFFGAGAGAPTVVGFTLGTGFGCGIVINRHIYIGTSETAGEIWFSPYKASFIEDYVSGRGLEQAYRELTGTAASPPQILEAATQGQPQALRAWEIFGQDLAYALAWSINILDPDLVVLGGSLTRGFEFFSRAMEEFLRSHITGVPAGKTRVVPSGLGESAGFIGAACLILGDAAA